ncbi:MAG: transaldolase [Actinomycetota bacterium]|nr:transaldolase [Actinomycetota bacterium]
MTNPSNLIAKPQGMNVKLFADGADLEDIRLRAQDPAIAGFTTNPTLMRKAGVSDYEAFARSVLEIVGDRPVSFEVFADDDIEILRQAQILSSWGPNVFVKMPVTNTAAVSTAPIIKELAARGVQQNVTALMTLDQVRWVADALSGGPRANISVFAGRVADTGRDPMPLMSKSVKLLADHPNIELIWASPREVLNIVQADEVGCHIITVTNDLLSKLGNLGKDLDDFSLDTVQMFFNDAAASGYSL